MSGGTYYVQECPTCGRSLQIRVAYLGKRVSCQHCAAKFEASDPSSADFEALDPSLSLLARAEELIETATRATASSSSLGEC